ncbi:hypothetical protein GCM10010439_21180 [Actinocorallia aurantiaca]|uniref:Uncharacterized protein n=1 Tax=Actinocorallia aurantiaca TaxID=46204 RepID=A0ABN3U5T5_9ACTN
MLAEGSRGLLEILGKMLRIEGVRGSNPLISTQVKGHFRLSEVAFLVP